MKKMICVALALVLLIGAFTGCSKNNGLDDKTVVATVNGVEVTADIYSFCLTQTKRQIEAEMNSSDVKDFWETAELEGKKLIETAREKALDEVVSIVVVEQKAAENKIKLTKEEEDALNSQVTSVIAQLGSRDKYNEWLAERGLNDEIYRRIMKRDYLLQKLLYENTEGSSEEAMLKYYNENVVRVKHILVESQDKAADKLNWAKELLARAKGGESFDSLVEQYSEDPGSKQQPEGYYLGEGFVLGAQGSMVPEFEAASLALKIGEVSDIVETDYGYHIIKRYENEQSAFEANKEQIQSAVQGELYVTLLDQWTKSAKVEVKNELIEQL